MADFVLWIAATGFVALVVWAALSDIATMLIPNRIPAGLVLLFVGAVLAAPIGWSDAAWFVGGGLAVFAVTLVLFALNTLGGGDAKLMPAIALWMGPSALLDFVFQTAVAGGLLGIGFLFIRRVPMPAGISALPWVARLMASDGGIPYGVAIAWGALAAAKASPLLPF